MTVSPSKSLLAGQHLEQHDAEGPDVGALVDGLAPRLLGGHVGGGAEDQAGRGAGAGQGRRLRQGGRAAGERVVISAPGLGEAEVEDLDLALRGQLDVRGLEVAVHDALLVGLLQRVGDLAGDRDRLVDGNRAALQALREILALDQLHGDEVDRSPTVEARALEAVEVGDVRMVERGEEPAFALEPGESLGIRRESLGQELERDLAAELRVGGAVDLAHPTGPEGRGDPVLRERLSDHCGWLTSSRAETSSSSRRGSSRGRRCRGAR